MLSLVVGVVVLFLMAAAALGDCPSEDLCLSEATRKLMFYGSPVGGLVVLMLAYRWLLKGGK